MGPSSRKLRKIPFTILLLFVVVFFSGCIELFGGGTTGNYYKNDVITVENYVITDSAPIPGSTTTIKFLLRNNGDKPVPSVIVDFYDLKGLPSAVECKNGNRLNNHACEYKNIGSLEDRNFAINFKIPDKDQLELRGDTTFKINYNIEYAYQGSRRIVIPIIDDTKLSQPITKFQTGQPSIGPIAAEFDPPVGRTTKKGDQTVKEYWGVKGSAFEVKVNFKLVGTTNVGKINPTTISTGKASLKLSGMTVDGERRCDFTGSSGTIYSKFDITVPESLVCNFKSTSFTNQENSIGQKTVAIDASFSYTYSIQRSDTITVSTERTQERQGSGTQEASGTGSPDWEGGSGGTSGTGGTGTDSGV